MATRPVEVTDTGHLLELLYDDGESDELLFCAGHGGAVEPGTAELALELATTHTDATCWATFGEAFDGSSFERWHPPSSEIDPDRFPLLGRIADREFKSVLSIHGLADDEILVGGGVEGEIKRAVVAHLQDVVSIPVSVATRAKYAGTSPENFVNWLADGEGGVQLELGPTARGPESARLREAMTRLVEADLLGQN